MKPMPDNEPGWPEPPTLFSTTSGLIPLWSRWGLAATVSSEDAGNVCVIGHNLYKAEQ